MAITANRAGQEHRWVTTAETADTVAAEIGAIRARAGIGHLPHAVLFSTRRFKQTGARYGRKMAAE